MKACRLAVFLSVGIFSAFVKGQSEWELFKNTYQKSYASEQEVIHRRNVFEDNLRYIESHNKLASLGHHTFTLGVNKFADLTVEEFQGYVERGGFIRSKESKKAATKFHSQGSDPDAVDWREKGAVTAVKDQGHCGSCWSFSATGTMEGAYFLHSSRFPPATSFSEQDLMDCGWGSAGVACSGGNPQAAMDFVIQRGGTCLESEYPYEGVQGICRYENNPLWNPKQHILPISQTGKVEKGNEIDLKSAVAQKGPVSVGIDAGHRSFQLYKEGIYRDPECSDIYLNHAVLAVGYGTQAGNLTNQPDDDFWIVKNSWGESWGDSGYVKMARNEGNMCGVATDPTWAQ